MADPLSILGCLLATSTIAAKASTTLHRVVKDTQTADDDIEDFATEAASFSAAMQLTRDVLNSAFNSTSSSAITEHITHLKLNACLSKQGRRAGNLIMTMSTRLQKVCKSKLSILVWVVFEKAELQKVRHAMESFKTTMIMIMLCFMLERTMRESPMNASRDTEM